MAAIAGVFVATAQPALAAGAAPPALAAIALETNAAGEPLGIDDPAPRLTWQLAATRRGVVQSAYQVIVATSPSRLDTSSADVWDSGKISSATPAAVYGGPALNSRTRYFWTLRVWDERGKPTAFAAPTWFETGYMSPSDWRGQWIQGDMRITTPITPAQGVADDSCCIPSPVADFCRPPGVGGFGTPTVDQGMCREVRPMPMLRKSFNVHPESGPHGAVVSARVYSAGLAHNNMTLNAKPTSTSVLDPGFTRYSRTVQYTAHDVTGLIRQNPTTDAENVIATQLGSGQFDNAATSLNWEWEAAEWRATPELRLDLYVRYADGTEQLIPSDTTWKQTTAGPTRFDNFYMGETYDARKEIAGWDHPGFDDAGWAAAQAATAPAGTLRAQREEATTVVADWPAGTRSNPKPGVVVYDTGQERSGWATISVHGAPAGTPIEILYAEKLNDGGTGSNAGFAANGQIQTDYYIAKGTGTASEPERFTPQFTYKGFQYVQLSSPDATALPADVTVTVDSVHEVRTPMPPSGRFSASNPLLDQIERNTRASIAENNVTAITSDTPVYEKNAWTGDAQLSAPTTALMFDSERRFWNDFQDMVDNQNADTGEVPILAPTNHLYGYFPQLFKAPHGAVPIWDAWWFVVPWEAYSRYGDLRGLEQTYPLMKKHLDVWIPRWTDTDGDQYRYTLTSQLGDWSPPTGADAPPGSPTDVSVPTVIAPSSTAYYAYMAKIAADSARALGDVADATRYEELFQKIRTDFNAKWWDAEAGFYREDPLQIFFQTLQAVGLAFGLVPDGERAGLQKKLVEDVMVTRAGHEEVGIVGARWILPVLSDAAAEGIAGAAEAASTIAAQTTYPSYGYWAKLGWTSLGENWGKSSRSRTHHMYGAIGQWFYEDLAGFTPLKPGYAEIRFRPTVPPSGLTSASASYESVRGKVAATWRSGADFEYDVTVPPTASGLVYFPGTNPSAVSEIGQDRHKPAQAAPGVSLVGVENGFVVYRVGSGTYKFRTASPTATGEGRSACGAALGFRSATAKPRGRGLRFGFERLGADPVRIDVFQVSKGSRVFHHKPRLVARFSTRKQRTWSGRKSYKGRRITDGYYFVRMAVRSPSGRTEGRRIALVRRGGRFQVKRPFHRRDTCARLRSFKLLRPVFGGTARAKLKISARLQESERVRISVSRKRRVVKRFVIKKAPAGRTLRFGVSAGKLPKGLYTVTITLGSGKGAVRARLYSRRI